MTERSAFGDSRLGISRRLREWAGDSVVRRFLTLVLQIGPVLLGAGSLPAAIGGSLAARVVVGLAVVFAIGYRVLDSRLTVKDDPSKGVP